ncbi:hypothetical protein PSAKL28_27630 [Pseudomonas alkylphenolica]|uniref:Uncharacterized protein n=2 Tax=Pseudomonas alkylphenolica TaxID=237609 RepID=A0A077FB94_9PSED|nr:hypothetical protein PSAKL28_27630 [Pseudomonas alkylphenolica]
MRPPTNWVFTMNSSSPAPAATPFDPFDKTQVQAFAKRGKGSARHTPPTVIEAPDGNLNPLLGATVRISYSEMDANDSVVVNWEGENESSQWSSLPTKVGNNNPLDIAVPAYIVIASAEMSVQITYIVIKDGVPSLSQPLALKIGPISQGPGLIHDDFEDAPLGAFTELKRPGMTIKVLSGGANIINNGLTNKSISTANRSNLEVIFDTEISLFAFSFSASGDVNKGLLFRAYASDESNVDKDHGTNSVLHRNWLSGKGKKIKKILFSRLHESSNTTYMLDDFWFV